MAYAKQQRQGVLADLIRSAPVVSQEDLTDQLASRGFTVTQATVSRDLMELGATKVRRSGQLVYALVGESAAAPGPRFETLLRQYARSIDTAMNLVVIRTPPGCAHLIGVAFDQAAIDGVAGNVCGDDTIFLACRSLKDADRLAGEFGALLP